MSNNDITLQTTQIYKILKTQNIPMGTIELFYRNDRIITYLVDNKYTLRISKYTLEEQMKLDKVKSVSFVSKIHSSGSFISSGQKYYFLISDYVQGNDLFSVLPKLTDDQRINIAKEIAQFLNELHSISDDYYDIGHYIPTIPRYKRAWKDGHHEYIELLRAGLSEVNTKSESKKVISKAFDYIHTNIDCLDYQTGAKLLHNDFHPKNIIIQEGKLAGIIDWECSQFGEADFELVHLFHWCIYPPAPANGLKLILKSIVENLRITRDVPNIEKRLTIYQLEHELNQLIWRGTCQEDERILRINGWLNGQIDALLGKDL